MPKPNLIIAGVQKGGTTWLHSLLRLHPDIFMSAEKELGFFNKPEQVRADTLPGYLANFDESGATRYRGESTPHYFWKKDEKSAFSSAFLEENDPAHSIDRLLDKDVRIIVSLRDPVSRAISAYHHHYAMGRHDWDKGIFHCPASLGIVDLGFYKRHIEHWDGIFGDRIKYVLFDDVPERPVELLDEIVEWLGLPVFSSWDKSRYLSNKINSRQAILKRKQGADKKEFPPLNSQEVSALHALYLPHIRFVESRLDVKLDEWRMLPRIFRKNAKAISD